MSELSTQFMSAEPANAGHESEKDLDPRLVQARLRIQTIQRFRVLYREIDFANPQHQIDARTRLSDLAEREYGKAWEILKQPGVEVVPLVIGGKTKEELKTKLLGNGFQISVGANEMIDSSDFATLAQPELIELVRFAVVDLSFLAPPKTDQIFAKAKELGLELCPPEVGPWYRLHAPKQPRGEQVYVGMRPVADTDRNPNMFVVNHDERGRSLSSDIVEPYEKWPSRYQFLFRLPVSRPEPTGATHG